MSTFISTFAALLGTLSIVNLLGAAGVGLGSTWALFRSRRMILTCQALGSLAFGLHYVLLGSPTAAIACSMSLLQSLLGQSGRRRSWLGACYAASYGVVVAGAIATWHGTPSLFVCFASLFAALGRLQASPQRMRLVFLFCSANWVVHNMIVGTAFGLTSDAISLTTIAYGLWRNRRQGPVEALRHGAALLGERLAVLIGETRPAIR